MSTAFDHVFPAPGPIASLRASFEGLRDRESAPSLWLQATCLSGATLSALIVVSGLLNLGLLHRALTPMAVAPLVACTFAARLSHPRLFPAAAAALGLIMVDALIGGVVYLAGDPAWAGALHLVVAALAFAASAVLTVRALMDGERTSLDWSDYLTLTKPRIMVLLLVTAVGAMFAAAGGMPPVTALLALIVGGAAASGGASALNHVLDRDIDKVMPRTKTRPVASGRISVAAAAEFGFALSAFSFVLMVGMLNLLAASLALAGGLFYVLVYTSFLKRKTALNIVIGGAAGAVPPLAGWAAGAGHLDPLALILFATIFFWTPPHFWALALLIKKDYGSAGIPMLPVTRGDSYTVRRIVAYALVTVAITVTPYVFGMLGLAYLAAALALGAAFVGLTIRLWAKPSKRAAGLVFHFSLLYLALLFVAVAVGASLV